MAYNLMGEFHYNTEDIDGGKGGLLLRLGDEISMPTWDLLSLVRLHLLMVLKLFITATGSDQVFKYMDIYADILFVISKMKLGWRSECGARH